MALVKYHLGYLQTLGSYDSPALENSKVFSGGLFGSLLGIPSATCYSVAL